MRGVAEGRGHPVPGPGPRVAPGLGKRPVEEGRAGAVEARGLLEPVLGVSGGQAVVVGGVAQLRGRGEADQGPGAAHHHAALITEGAVDSAAVVGCVVARKSAAIAKQPRIVKCQDCTNCTMFNV